MLMNINFESVLLSYTAFLISITIHEFAHAWMADHLGDPTPRKYNRLEPNPITIIQAHPFGALVVPLIGAFQGLSIGWAATPVNPHLVDKKYTIRQAERLISIAGPVSNLILAFIACLIFAFLSKQMLVNQDDGNQMMVWMEPIYNLSQSLIIINLFLALFNLLPVPPLDGFSVFANLLPARSGLVSFILQYQQVFLIFIFVFAGKMLYPFVMQLASIFLQIAYFLVG